MPGWLSVCLVRFILEVQNEILKGDTSEKGKSVV